MELVRALVSCLGPSRRGAKCAAALLVARTKCVGWTLPTRGPPAARYVQRQDLNGPTPLTLR